MKMLRYLIPLLVLLMFALPTRADEESKTSEKNENETSEPRAVQWLSYADALAKSQSENKHALIYFVRNGCGWCRLMERQTYTDSNVIRILEEHFAPTTVWGDSNKELEIDGYKITERNLATVEFGVTGYPEFWFLTPDYIKVGPLKGYLPADRFVKALEFVKDYRYDTTRTEQSDSVGQEGE